MKERSKKQSRRFKEKKKRGSLDGEWRKGLSANVKRFYKERELKIREDSEDLNP